MMRSIKAAVVVSIALAGACLISPTPAPAQSFAQGSTSIRDSAILTNSDVLSTTFSMASKVKAVHFYIDFTKGSLTSATFAPAGAKDGNPAATGYFKDQARSITVTADGRYHIRIPRDDLGAYRYAGIFAVGTGTATSSAAQISAKYEY